ncbi:hypothetical protein [Alteromonas oceanisediminis]|uniref:hypothetical protein n=1 Tax=Alteromonas oceanisediminis TaxID=2836180 RepID=UPI001BD9925A|nr:hypothetical protein [Alteromonas oceanisediminis]MBT0586670.1 hypothetical protein [Alteromonas oceanisediminis]
MKISIMIIVLLVSVGALLKLTGVTSMSPLLTFIAAFGLFMVIGLGALVVARKRNRQ